MQSLAEIAAHLAVVRDGAVSALDDVMPSARALLGVDNLLIYGIGEHLAGWQVARWHPAGDDERFRAMRARFERLLAASRVLAERRASEPDEVWRSSGVMFYNPKAPAPAMRNIVVDGVAEADRAAPGAWRASAMCREVFEPVGMEQHRHFRVLACDGDQLLGWFGTLVPGELDEARRMLLGELGALVRTRLAAERRLALAPHAANVLSVVLGRLAMPALLVTGTGAIVEANAPARALLETARRDLEERITAALRGATTGVTLTQIASAGAPALWLAELPLPAAARLDHAVEAAVARWKLTPRQRQVLQHLVHGESNVAIAEHLRVGRRSIELHVSALLERAGVESRSALVAAVLGG